MSTTPLNARRLFVVVLALALASALAPPRAEAAATVDGQFANIGLRSAGMTTRLPVAGRGGVAGDASAVTLNVTSTGSLAAGFVTVYPCGTPRPNTSNLNFAPGATVANAVTSRVGDGGAVCIYNSAPTHVIVDVSGYHQPSARFNAVDPARLVDTRGGSTPGAGMTTRLPVAGRGGVAGDASAVTLNVTSTGSLAAGFVTVYPCGTPRPNTSNLNFAPGATVANAVTSRVGDGGAVCIYNSAPTHVIVDVSGYYPPSSRFGAVDPARLVDTRGGSTPGAGMTTRLPVAGRGGVAGDASAVTLNVTSTGSLAAGFVTVYPCGTPRPNTSNLNFAPGATVANAVTSRVGDGGAVCIYNSAPTHVIVDVSGYYQPSARFNAVDPARLVDTRGGSTPGAAAEEVGLTLLNQLRASRGLGPVVPDATMTAFARSWSATMSQSGFRHSTGPYSENIGTLSGVSWTPQSVAAALHDAFVASPSHFANMTNPNWTAVGVGAHLAGTTWYITFEFR